MKKITFCKLNTKSRMIKACTAFALILSFLSSGVTAQTFWTETFSNGCTSNCNATTYTTGPNGPWTVASTGTNDPEGNVFYVSCAENGNAAGACGSGCGSDASLHVSSNPTWAGDLGAAYEIGGFCGVIICVSANLRAESPTINCTGFTGITLAFNYMEFGDGANDDASLWYFDGAAWSPLMNLAKTACCGGPCTSGSLQGQWTAFSIALPASANNNPNVKIGFNWTNNDDGVGFDPSFAVDDITLTVPASANSITTGAITGSPFCACSAVSVPFTSTGTFTAGNIYTAELSNAAGSFAAPVAIGTLASTANTGTIAATIPCGTATGAGYRIRVVSSAPVVTGTDNGVNITITQPSVGTFSYTGTPYCQNAADPSPTFSGGGIAGTFTSTAGLVFVSAATGQVNLAASTPGTYTVTNTIAASGGCPAVTATSPITVTAVQSAAFSYSSATFCSTGTNPVPTITGTAGGTFSASPAGLTFVSTATGEINLASTSLNTYTITYTTPGPCPGTSSVSVTITNSPVATFSYTGTPYCQNAADPSPTFSGGGTAGSFTSTAGLIFISASTGEVNLAASTPGTYTVTNTIAASGGCPAVTATSPITINAVQSSAFSYSSSTFCSSGTNPVPTITGTAGGTFSASPAGLTFVSTATGEIDLASTALNTYTITYTTAGPCATSSTASITITNAPVATFSYTGTPYCQTAADPSPTFSGGGTAGVFSSTAGLSINASTGDVSLSGSTPGTYTVTNTIAASGGCPAATATSTITITAPQTGAFSYPGTPYCQTAADPSPVYSGGGIAGTYTSTAGLSINSATGDVSLSGSTAGTYTVTNTIAAAGGCPATTYTATITITIPPVATFSYTGTPYCQNDPDPSPSFSGGGVAGTFSSTAGLTINATTGTVTLVSSTPGTYTVTNTIAASGGCAAVTATSTITINAAPTVTVNSATICAGQTATLTASGATTYSWSAGATSTGANTATASPAATTSYTVTGTTAGCTGTAVAVVTVNSCNVPVANFTADVTSFCNSGCVNFTDLSTNSPTSWAWSFPGGTPASSTSQNPTNICYSANGSYDVTLIATNANGSDTLTQAGYITVGNPVQVTISGNTVINACETTTLYADPTDGTYSWTPNIALSCGTCSAATVAPTTTTEYTVTYTSPSGCTDTETVTVSVENIFTYYMPTGFSPNGDGVNDELHVQGRGIDYISLKIFDRIGEKVFDTTDPETGWNGKLLGLPMNDGVFVYALEVTFCNGDTVKEHGSIVLAK